MTACQLIGSPNELSTCSINILQEWSLPPPIECLTMLLCVAYCKKSKATYQEPLVIDMINNIILKVELVLNSLYTG